MVKHITDRLYVLQSSVVILTQFQYPALFSSLASALGPLYQQHGLPMLESACYSMSNWWVRFRLRTTPFPDRHLQRKGRNPLQEVP